MPASAYIASGYGQATALVVPPPIVLPGIPVCDYDPTNIDSSNNSTLTDGQGVGSYYNAGSISSAAVLTQATAGAKPLFRLVAEVGKLNGLPALEFDGARYISSGFFTALAQPTIVALVFKLTDLGRTHTVFDGGSATSNISVISGSGEIDIYSGANGVCQTIPAGIWQMLVVKFNGATSFARLNGSQTANVNAGTNSSSAASLGAFGGGTIMKGMIARTLIFNGGTLPAPVDIETYIKSKYAL